MATTTAVELRNVTRNHPTRRIDTTSGPPPDDILEASRLADSTVPEGGYGWVVVAGCTILSWWSVGIVYCWGVIQSALVVDGLSSPATLSFIGSLAAAAVSFYALLNAWVYRRLGARTTAMLGVSLIGLAEILSSFTVETVAGLFITGGVLLGFGVSLCFTTVASTPAQYFSRKRGIANGIVFAGGGLGGAITSFTLDYVIKGIGMHSTYRVLGLATLGTGLPAAWFVRGRVPPRAVKFIDWSLFRDVKFLVIFVSGAIATFPLLVPPFFLPQYSQSLGLSSATGAGILAGFNFASAVGRIAAGFLCDAIGSLNTLLIVTLLNTLSMLIIWPVSTTLGPLVLFAVINGAANGGFFSTMPTVVGNVFGSQRVSVAMGMTVTAWAGGYLMGAPIAGYLLQAYGGTSEGLGAYKPAIFYAGFMAFGAAFFVAFARLYTSKVILKKV